MNALSLGALIAAGCDNRPVVPIDPPEEDATPDVHVNVTDGATDATTDADADADADH